jgi:hypothetical protein
MEHGVRDELGPEKPGFPRKDFSVDLLGDEVTSLRNEARLGRKAPPQDHRARLHAARPPGGQEHGDVVAHPAADVATVSSHQISDSDIEVFFGEDIASDTLERKEVPPVVSSFAQAIGEEEESIFESELHLIDPRRRIEPEGSGRLRRCQPLQTVSVEVQRRRVTDVGETQTTRRAQLGKECRDELPTTQGHLRMLHHVMNQRVEVERVVDGLSKRSHS